MKWNLNPKKQLRMGFEWFLKVKDYCAFETTVNCYKCVLAEILFNIVPNSPFTARLFSF